MTGPAGGYRLRAGTAMPPLLLDEEEAIAIAVGLRTAARTSVTGIEETSIRALVKLEQVLPSHLRRRVAALGSATVAAPVGGPTVDPQHLTTIAAACRDTERLRFAYRSRDGAETRRDVEPHSLVNLGRRWYLVAWDRGARGLAHVPRRPAQPSRRDGRAVHAAPAAGGGRGGVRRAEHLGRRHRYEARVTVHAPAERLAARLPWVASALEPIDASAASTAPTDDELEWLALRIVMLDEEVDVHEPPELVAMLRGLARRLQRATGGEG